MLRSSLFDDYDNKQKSLAIRSLTKQKKLFALLIIYQFWNSSPWSKIFIYQTILFLDVLDGVKDAGEHSFGRDLFQLTPPCLLRTNRNLPEISKGIFPSKPPPWFCQTSNLEVAKNSRFVGKIDFYTSTFDTCVEMRKLVLISSSGFCFKFPRLNWLSSFGLLKYWLFLVVQNPYNYLIDAKHSIFPMSNVFQMTCND